MRPTKYLCSNCDFSGSTTSLWGLKNYKSNSLEVSVEIHPAICYDCNSITPVENLPTLESIKYLENLTKEFPKLQSYYENKLEEEKLRFEMLRNRESSPKCLNCGGQDFELLIDSIIDSGYEHRCCGGKIYKRLQDYSLNKDEMFTSYFNIEGNRTIY